MPRPRQDDVSDAALRMRESRERKRARIEEELQRLEEENQMLRKAIDSVRTAVRNGEFFGWEPAREILYLGKPPPRYLPPGQTWAEPEIDAEDDQLFLMALMLWITEQWVMHLRPGQLPPLRSDLEDPADPESAVRFVPGRGWEPVTYE